MNATWLIALSLMLLLIAGCEDKSRCRVCDGRGVVSVWQPYGGYQKALCMECYGTGEHLDDSEPVEVPSISSPRVLVPLAIVATWISASIAKRGKSKEGTDRK